MPGPRTITGAHVICYVNGARFGRVTSVIWKSATPRKAIYGLDSVDPHELAPTTTRISFTVNLLRTIGDGGAEGAGMAANYEDLPREKYFTMQLVDRSTDTVLFQAQYCSVTMQSWSIPIKDKVTGVLEAEAITWSNEVKPLGVSA